MVDGSFNVLFLCTGNTARSVLAESILRKDGAGRFNAFSAGSRPKGDVNPLTLRTLRLTAIRRPAFVRRAGTNLPTAGSPQMDFVFTVCDDAAGEACPVWPGHPITAHWGIADPAAAEGSEIDRERAFNAAFRFLRNRISAFLALPFDDLDGMTLGARLKEIGRRDGATALAGRRGE